MENMTKRTKIGLLHATVFAVVNIIFFIIVNIVASDLIWAWSFPRGGESPAPWPLIVLVAWFFLIILWILVLVVFYMIHIVKTDRIPRKLKVLVAVFILLAHILVMPIYWYLFIEPELAADNLPKE